MLVAFMSGFTLGFSLIAVIGGQNAFVLRQGIRGQFILAVVLVCTLSDIVLISTGVAGAGLAVNIFPTLDTWLIWAGAAFLFVYGALSFRSAFTDDARMLEPMTDSSSGLWKTIGTCLVLTWANPHVYLDTLVLLGSVSSRFGDRALYFGAGAILASFTFFFGLGYGARILRPLFAQPMAWRILDGFVGGVMWVVAAGLLAG